jgi:DNA-binding MarR family transcriptional regulator
MKLKDDCYFCGKPHLSPQEKQFLGYYKAGHKTAKSIMAITKLKRAHVSNILKKLYFKGLIKTDEL